MKIVYRPHLRRRIKERGFPTNYPKKIYKVAKLRFRDSQTGHLIAVAEMEYAGKLRKLAISYDIIEEQVEIITIHPILEGDVKKRVKSGRWRRNEEKEK